MIKKRISIITPFTGVSIVTAFFAAAILGFSLYHYGMIADQFDHLVSYAVEKTLDLSKDLN